MTLRLRPVPTVRLRLLRPSDASPAWLAWLRSPAVRRWITANPRTLADLRRGVRHWQRQPGAWAYGIFVGDRHIGNLKLERVTGSPAVAELGLLIGPAEWRGKGYGTQAIVLGVARASRLGFRFVRAGLDVANTASRRAFHHAGFFEIQRSLWAIRALRRKR